MNRLPLDHEANAAEEQGHLSRGQLLWVGGSIAWWVSGVAVAAMYDDYQTASMIAGLVLVVPFVVGFIAALAMRGLVER